MSYKAACMELNHLPIPQLALREAIRMAGGQSALARVCGKDQGHVSHWLKSAKGVPAEHCPAIEDATGVRCEKLRPDVRWEVLRRGSIERVNATLVSGPQAQEVAHG